MCAQGGMRHMLEAVAHPQSHAVVREVDGLRGAALLAAGVRLPFAAAVLHAPLRAVGAQARDQTALRHPA